MNTKDMKEEQFKAITKWQRETNKETMNISEKLIFKSIKDAELIQEAIQSLSITKNKNETTWSVNEDGRLFDFAMWAVKYMYTKHSDGYYRTPINVLAKHTLQELYDEYLNAKNWR